MQAVLEKEQEGNMEKWYIALVLVAAVLRGIWEAARPFRESNTPLPRAVVWIAVGLVIVLVVGALSMLLWEGITFPEVHPPDLTLSWEGGSAQAWLGTYTWSQPDDTHFPLISGQDSGHVLDAGSFLTRLPVQTGTRLTLTFDRAPDQIAVKRWPEEYLGRLSEARVWPVELEEGNVLPLEGGMVYEVFAVWEGDRKDSTGNGHYGFQVPAAP